MSVHVQAPGNKRAQAAGRNHPGEGAAAAAAQGGAVPGGDGRQADSPCGPWGRAGRALATTRTVSECHQLQALSMHARRPEGATDLDEGANGAVHGGAAAPGDDGREADGAPGPSGSGAPAAEDPSEFLAGEGEDPGAYAARIFQRVFCNDIESVLRMDVRCFPPLLCLPCPP